MVAKATIKVDIIKDSFKIMLSDGTILNLIQQEKLKISPFNKNNLGCASIDLTLSKFFLKYSKKIDTRSKKNSTLSFQAKKLTLRPGEFILGMTAEKVKISSDYYGFIETKGNFSRAGISVTCDDGHIDPGTNGHITLEIQNRNSIDVTIYSGDIICQIFFFLLSSPATKLYSGKYSNQKEPTAFYP